MRAVRKSSSAEAGRPAPRSASPRAYHSSARCFSFEWYALAVKPVVPSRGLDLIVCSGQWVFCRGRLGASVGVVADPPPLHVPEVGLDVEVQSSVEPVSARQINFCSAQVERAVLEHHLAAAGSEVQDKFPEICLPLRRLEEPPASATGQGL